MLVQCGCQLDRQPGHQPALGHLGRDQGKRTVPAVLDNTTRPADPGVREGAFQRLVHAVPDCHLICVGPGRVAELLHINDQDRPVYSRLISSQISHLSNDSAHHDEPILRPSPATSATLAQAQRQSSLETNCHVPATVLPLVGACPRLAGRWGSWAHGSLRIR